MAKNYEIRKAPEAVRRAMKSAQKFYSMVSLIGVSTFKVIRYSFLGPYLRFLRRIDVKFLPLTGFKLKFPIIAFLEKSILP